MERAKVSELLLPTEIQNETMKSPIRSLLKNATHDVHNRMHNHDGFSAIKQGKADKRLYNLLLRRLYGFYRPFELCAEMSNERSGWLYLDLTVMGTRADEFDSIPTCNKIPDLSTPNRRLGSLYVVAGSALGGRELSRGLDALLGVGVTSGREFFLGFGDRTGEIWRQYLASLNSASTNPGASKEIVGAAIETFAAFEHWAAGWKDKTNG